MASAIIHLTVANEINKKLKKDNDNLLIGSVAPDIAKYIGENKVKSHFLDDEKIDIPNIEKFLSKYQNKLSDDFVLGYFIHLYTDYLWFKYFLPKFGENGMLRKLDGTILKCTEETFWDYIYEDYNKLDCILLDEYNIDLHILNSKIPKIENIIEEIPMEQLNLITNEVSHFATNSCNDKTLFFDVESIKSFIFESTQLIIDKIKELEK